MIGAVILIIALVCTAFAQLTYKLYFARHGPLDRLMGALALFGLAQIGFFAALTQLEIGEVYMSMGAVQILVLGLSRYVLHEKVTWNHMVAVMMIVGGLICYAG